MCGTNVVSACRRCNHLKADRSVAELGWRMRHAPFHPIGPAWRILGAGRAIRAGRRTWRTSPITLG